jgi:uncharacterized membrane protein
MKTANAILMKEARESLSGRWGLAVGVSLVYLIISAIIAPPPAFLILTGPMTVGFSTFIMAFTRKKESDISQLAAGFQNFGTSLIAYLLMTLYIILWSLLLIIPGIIAAISYSQTYFIIAEEKSIDPMEALRKSQEMMKGLKWKYFCLLLRFTGWFILSALTLGIGFVFLFPYIQVTLAKFYDDVKK